MQSEKNNSVVERHMMSPSIVELLNEAVVLPVERDSSVSIIPSLDLRLDSSLPPLGSGTFATCVSATKGQTISCVVKIYRSLDYDLFHRELTAMLSCNRHKFAHIVELWWVCMPPPGTMDLPRLVMPLVTGVMMAEWLCGLSGRVRPARLLVAVQLVKAVSYLHDVVGIVHGDLSMKNVMIDATRNHHLTLIDFGNARKVAKGQPRIWVHGHYFLSPPEALAGRLCERVLAEIHVLGVLLICIDHGRTLGLCDCPSPFEEGKDEDDKCAIARLVRFWGRARLFPYWNEFLKKAGKKIEQVTAHTGTGRTGITGNIGRAGLCLADPFPHSRQSLSETLRHLASV